MRDRSALYAAPFILLIVCMFIAAWAHFYTENFDSEVYAMRICDSEYDYHTRARFNEMKSTVETMRALNQSPLGLLIPDQWDKMTVLPKKIWVKK